MSFNNEVQKLAPGEVIQLIEIDGTAFGAAIMRFHAHNIPHSQAEIAAAAGGAQQLRPKSLWWQGNEYEAYPYEITGLAATTDGSQPTPKLSVANISNLVTSLCLTFNDMVQAKVRVHDTFAKYLDAVNFPEGNALADASQERVQVFYIDSKSTETNSVVEFQLCTPFDLQGQRLPSRQIHGLCTWCIRGWYRSGRGCDYSGSACFDKDDKPIGDPALDVCGGRVSSCKKRFGDAQPLAFGGFPGSNLLGEVTMQAEIMQAICEHAAAEYPNESCGFVVQNGREARYLPCRNVAENALDNFVIPPQDYALAEDHGEIIRIIHSHPDVPVLIPSEMDRLQCDHSGIVWGIVSWPEGDYTEIAPRGERPLVGRSWLLGHADCWSLIRDYYRQEHDIALNDYSVEHQWWIDGKTRLYDDNWYGEGFREFEGPMQAGDVIMMQVSAPVTNHAGIYLGDNLMLHHLFGQLSQRYPYSGYFQERTVRVVRRKELYDANNQTHPVGRPTGEKIR